MELMQLSWLEENLNIFKGHSQLKFPLFRFLRHFRCSLSR
jgi:hypothetical protein